MNATKRIATLTSAIALGLSLGLQPFSVNLGNLDTGLSSALAKGGEGNGGGNGGNGGGNGGGNAGGNGGGNAGGNGGGSSGSDSRGSKGGNGPDTARSSQSGSSARSTNAGGAAAGARQEQPLGLVEGFVNDLTRSHKQTPSTRAATSGKDLAAEKKAAAKAGAKEDEKTSASSLGRLNAAHASPQARASAAANSTVGRIATYRSALQDDRIEDAAAALAEISNKTITTQSIRSLNDLLGISAEDEQIKDLLAEVQAIQDKAPSTATKTVATADESLGRLNAAHASTRAQERAAANSAAGRIGAYKAAVESGDLDAAAKALAAASNKPVTAETVRNLNALLDTSLTDQEVTTLVEKTEALDTKAKRASR